MSFELRPSDMVKRLHRTLRKDFGEFVDADTGEFLPEHARPVPACPACGSPDHHRIVTKLPVVFDVCESCGTNFQNPAITKETLAKWYAKSEAAKYAESIRLKTFDLRKNEKFGPIFDRYRDLLSKGRILDVGCSWGYFMDLVAESADVEVEGIELQTDTADWVRKNKGYRVFDHDIRFVSGLENRYDAIFVWGTMTHVEDPRSFFKACHDALKPGGAVLVGTPNCRGFEFSLADMHELFQATVVQIFSTQGLLTAMADGGFEAPRVTQYGRRDIDIVRDQTTRNAEAADRLPPFLADLLAEEGIDADRRRQEFQDFLTINCMSAFFEAVAHKRS